VIPIVWHTYESKLAGTAVRTTVCEECGTEYTYYFTVYETGRSHAVYGIKAREAESYALKLAKQRVRRHLEDEPAAAPCPECGWVQRHMYPVAQKQACSWMKPLGFHLVYCTTLLFPLTVLVAGAMCGSEQKLHPIVVVPIVGFLAWIAGLGFLIARPYVQRSYDPNKAVPQAERIELGRAYANPPDEIPPGIEEL
jgi:hypothetical protein